MIILKSWFQVNIIVVKFRLNHFGDFGRINVIFANIINKLYKLKSVKTKRLAGGIKVKGVFLFDVSKNCFKRNGMHLAEKALNIENLFINFFIFVLGRFTAVHDVLVVNKVETKTKMSEIKFTDLKSSGR